VRPTLPSEAEAILTGVAGHIGNYADAVRVPDAAELIYSSGTPGLRPDGTLPQDFSDEAAQAWRNVEDALHRAGAGLADIISVRNGSPMPPTFPPTRPSATPSSITSPSSCWE
jgi:enamine deaminase RidA (YjgF/YER057c/UK114 family)